MGAKGKIGPANTTAMMAVALLAVLAMGAFVTAGYATAWSGGAAIDGLAAHPATFNPFTGSTSIDYNVTGVTDGMATVSIYNPDRHIVRAINGGLVSTGSHGIAWDGKTGTGDWLSDGLYTANLSVIIQGNTSQLPAYALTCERYATEEYLNHPQGVAVDKAGNIYVLDTGNDRVLKYDPDGRLITQWGGQGVNPGQFWMPRDITVDSTGNVWVLDAWNMRVQVFDSDGRFLKQWGIRGNEPELWVNSNGFTIDDDGYVYIACCYNSDDNIIKKFTDDGQLVLSWGYENAPEKFTPFKMAADHLGNIYVTAQYGYVMKFSSTGALLASNRRQIAGFMIATNRSGCLFLFENNSITTYDPDGRLLSRWSGPGYEDVQLSLPQGMAVDESGNVYVADTCNDRIVRFNTSGKLTLTLPREIDPRLCQSRGVAADISGNIYVADTGRHRVQKFGPDGEFTAAWGSFGRDPGQFSLPQGIATDCDGNVFVADTGNYRIQKFDATGKFLLSWGSEGSDNGQFRCPAGIALDSAGNVYVADTNNYRVQKFDGSGKFLLSWGSRGTDNDHFLHPWSIAVDGADNVYVLDVDDGMRPIYNEGSNPTVVYLIADTIKKFDSSGRFLSSWGSLGSDTGNFSNRQGIAADVFGNVYAANPYGSQVRKFSATGVLLATFGTYGNGPGQTVSPGAVAVDASGNVYVVSAGNGRVLKYTQPWITLHAETGVRIDNLPLVVVSTWPASGVADVPLTANIGATFSEPVTLSDVTVTDEAGNVVAGIITVDGAKVTFAPASALLSDSVYTVEVCGVKDADGNALQGGHNWSFSTENRPPLVTSVICPGYPVRAGIPVVINGTFDDPGRGTHTALWSWGDATESAGMVTENGSGGTVSGSHVYTRPGLHTVTLTVTDRTGVSGSMSFRFLTVFDPDAGFVTGGGWIDVLSGEGRNSPLDSLASFSFTSKYSKGALAPGGLFRFSAQGVDFRATSQEWLIIMWNEAQITGHGTVNGAGDYRFFLAAADAAAEYDPGADRIRIKIWSDEEDGERVVYDSQPGEPVNVRPLTPVKVGSVVIH